MESKNTFYKGTGFQTMSIYNSPLLLAFYSLLGWRAKTPERPLLWFSLPDCFELIQRHRNSSGDSVLLLRKYPQAEDTYTSPRMALGVAPLSLTEVMGPSAMSRQMRGDQGLTGIQLFHERGHGVSDRIRCYYDDNKKFYKVLKYFQMNKITCFGTPLPPRHSAVHKQKRQRWENAELSSLPVKKQYSSIYKGSKVSMNKKMTTRERQLPLGFGEVFGFPLSTRKEGCFKESAKCLTVGPALSGEMAEQMTMRQEEVVLRTLPTQKYEREREREREREAGKTLGMKVRCSLYWLLHLATWPDRGLQFRLQLESHKAPISREDHEHTLEAKAMRKTAGRQAPPLLVKTCKLLSAVSKNENNEGHEY
eukprot:bmy_16461T0